MHKQVPVKVNAFCDEGIAELVSALAAWVHSECVADY
jgi:hypothetical protein